MNKQTAFVNTTTVSGIALAIIISALVYFVNTNQTEPAPENEVVTTSENNTSEKKDNTLFSVTTSTDIDLSALDSSFQIDSVDTYRISLTDTETHDLTVAVYKDEQGQDKRSIIFIPEEETSDNATIEEKAKKAVNADKPAQFRYEKWLKTAEAIKKHTDEQSLFVSFWDNAQRIHLFTGRDIWISGPDKNAYGSEAQQNLWESIAGGFDTKGALSKYSHILLQDMDNAVPALQKELPEEQDTYILISSDDLSRVQEISALTGQGLPLETKLFPTDADLHNSISKVKEWAKEGNGTGSYLVQPVSERFNRVWRVTDPAFEESLLIRLLPFSSSLDKPLENMKLVYQSDWGAYLSIYKL